MGVSLYAYAVNRDEGEIRMRRSRERRLVVRLTVDVPEETWIRPKAATAEERATIKDLLNQVIEIYLKATDVRPGVRISLRLQ